MGSLELGLRLVGGVLLTGGNAFFVVTEFALTRLPQLDPSDTALPDLAEPVVWVDPELPVSALIDRLQQKQQEIALVRTEDHVRGLVTSTDAFEAIAGELEDPGDVGREGAGAQAADSVEARR